MVANVNDGILVNKRSNQVLHYILICVNDLHASHLSVGNWDFLVFSSWRSVL